VGLAAAGGLAEIAAGVLVAAEKIRLNFDLEDRSWRHTCPLDPGDVAGGSESSDQEERQDLLCGADAERRWETPVASSKTTQVSLNKGVYP
jgi:hypothetical protein